jgi:UDP-3-O-[3-hydroxymyristoyl] glucosamine N-acyltransferase
MAVTPELRIEEIITACRGTPIDAAALAGKRVRAVAPIHDAHAESVSWIAEAKHAKHLGSSQAAAIIGTQALLAGCPKGIIVADPELAIAHVLELFDVPPSAPAAGRHPMAVVHPTSDIADDVCIGAFAVIDAGSRVGPGTVIHEGVSIGSQVKIGANCTLYDRCVLYDRTTIGDGVILHAGVVLGADGFGFIFRDGKHRKLAHVGHVIVEDDVEIGPNTVVDRGKLGPTRIGRGSKIDALVMIGHNVQIGPLSVLAGQAGLSGSVRLGAGVAVGGQVGISQGVTVGDQVRIGAQSGVLSDIPAGQSLWGTPAQDRKNQMRDHARVRKLQKLYDEVKELTQRVKELEAAADHRKHG